MPNGIDVSSSTAEDQNEVTCTVINPGWQSRDSVVWLVEHQMVRQDLLSIPSCITVRDLAKHFSLCLSSVKALTSPSLTFLHRLPRKAAQKAARALKNVLINVEVFSAFQKVLSGSYHSVSWSSTCFLTTAGGEPLHSLLWTGLVMVTRIPA